MKTIKHSMSIILVLVVAVALAVGIEACAKTAKAPTGRLLYYEYNYGGGMNPLEETIYHLHYDDAGVPQVTVSGDCQGERITFSVGPEVFERCAEIIKEHRLYRSKGHYEEKYQVLDAPSAGFHIGFEGHGEFISGSGAWPKFIDEGVSAVNSYLRSLVGDRKAEGHVDRIFGGDDLPGMHWTDGFASLTTSDTDATELKRHVRSLSTDVPEDARFDGMGYERFHDGDQHYILICDYTYRRSRLFYSFDGGPATIKAMVEQQMAALKAVKPTDTEKWPIVNQRFLSQPMLAKMSEQQLREMLDNIREMKLSPYGGITRKTDIGEVNSQLINAELHRFGKK